MATETLKKVSAQIQLENGRDEEGNMKYVNQTIQYIGASGYDGNKLLSVVGALSPCLAKTVGRTNAIKTYTVGGD